MAKVFGMHDANVTIDDAGESRLYEASSVLCRGGDIAVRTHAGVLLAEGSGVVDAVRVPAARRTWKVTLASGAVWTVIQSPRRCLSCN